MTRSLGVREAFRMFLDDLFGPSIIEIKRTFRIPVPTEWWASRMKAAADQFTAVTGGAPDAFLLAPADFGQFVNDCRVGALARGYEPMKPTVNSTFAFFGADVLPHVGVPRGTIHVRGPIEVYLVGQNCEGREWEVQGVYTDRFKAEKRCEDENWFVMPLRLNEFVPTETTDNVEAYYPLGAALPSSPPAQDGDA